MGHLGALVMGSLSGNLWDCAWPAPAKLNLMLRVVGRRPDGYHLLQTVFQFVELCDRIKFAPYHTGRELKKNFAWSC